jgi:hypothetical protein
MLRPARRRATARPKPRNKRLSLFSSPMPASRPKASQRRCSPVRRRRATSHQHALHSKRSKAFIEKNPHSPR